MRQSDSARLTVPDPEATRAFGRALGLALRDHSGGPLVVAIRGDLGAGKTTLVGGLLNGIGVPGVVRSPTYTLIEPYEVGERRFYHLDLYRLADPREVEALGLRDLLSPQSVLLIEWPERGAGFIPAADLSLDLSYGEPGQGRTIDLASHTPAGAEVQAWIGKVQ